MQRLLILGVSVAALAGCTGSSPPTRFYVLDPVAIGANYPNLPLASNLAIGVGPIKLPDLLDRPHIVARGVGQGVDLGEFDHWAGSLRANMARFMARQLMQQLGTERVSISPWPRHRRLDYQVAVDVLRFDGELGGSAELSGTWTLVDGNGRAELASAAFSLSDRTGGPDYAHLVASLGRLTAELTSRIAMAIHKQAGGGG